MVPIVSFTSDSTDVLEETSAWRMWNRGVDGCGCVLGILDSSSTNSEAREALEA